MNIIKTTLFINRPTTIKGVNSIALDDCKKKYYLSIEPNYEISEYHWFPFLVDELKGQWLDGNRYLLWRIKEKESISHKTLFSIASALKDFKEFCEKEEIDYRKAPRKILRPPWLYRKHLMSRAGDGTLSFATIKTRLSSVAGFYEWLIKVEGVEFKYSIYKAEKRLIKYVDSVGNQRVTEVESKDLSRVSVAKSVSEDTGTIVDEGRLKPLSKEEQRCLVDALDQLENPEMLLGFFIALLTGARIQTVYTLRLRHFERNVAEDDEIKLLVGPGTQCDTKGDKLYHLYFPGWLYRHMQIYAESERAKNRRRKAKKFENERDQYFFLTRAGEPYYVSKADPLRTRRKLMSTGEAVRQFLYTRLHDRLLKNGCGFKFSFHDLRATYCVNYIYGDENEPFEGDRTSFRKRLVEASTRMGHSSILITERYAKFKDVAKEKYRVQNDFEAKMRSILNEGKL